MPLQNTTGMHMISVGINAAKGKSTVCRMKSYGEVIVPPRDICSICNRLRHIRCKLLNLSISI